MEGFKGTVCSADHLLSFQSHFLFLFWFILNSILAKTANLFYSQRESDSFSGKQETVEMDGWMTGWMDEWTAGGMDEQQDGGMEDTMDGGMEKLQNGWIL